MTLEAAETAKEGQSHTALVVTSPADLPCPRGSEQPLSLGKNHLRGAGQTFFEARTRPALVSMIRAWAGQTFGRKEAVNQMHVQHYETPAIYGDAVGHRHLSGHGVGRG